MPHFHQTRNHIRQAPCYRSRSGITLIELLVSCALLATMVAIVAPVTMRVARQRSVHREIIVARHELVNQMQRLTRLTPQELNETNVVISEAHRELLLNAELKMRLETDETDDGAAAKIQLALQWTNRLGIRGNPQILTAWSQPAEESSL